MNHYHPESGGERLSIDDKKELARLTELLRRHDSEIGQQAFVILNSKELTPAERYSGVVDLYLRHVPAANTEAVIDVEQLHQTRDQELCDALVEFNAHVDSQRQPSMEYIRTNTKEVWDSALFLGTLAVASADTVMLDAVAILKSRARRVLMVLSAGAALTAANDVFLSAEAGSYDKRMLLSAVTGGVLGWLSSATYRVNESSTPSA